MALSSLMNISQLIGCVMTSIVIIIIRRHHLSHVTAKSLASSGVPVSKCLSTFLDLGLQVLPHALYPYLLFGIDGLISRSC